jgi:hypothetical protein
VDRRGGGGAEQLEIARLLLASGAEVDAHKSTYGAPPHLASGRRPCYHTHRYG